jgi:choice-of-anchor A domain-containing protein
VTSGEVGVAFNSGAMTVTGGTSPYTFSVVGTLPAGLSLNASNGAVTGTATAAGSFTIKVVDSNGVAATGTCLITIIAGPSLSCSSVTSGEVGVAFNSGAMTVTGGTSPYTFSVVGTLPAGLTLNASNGAVTGTATAAGSFTIKVVDSNGVAATGTCLITIIAGPSLSCSSVTSGEVGVAFNSGAMTVTGGTSPYTFSVVGTLPAGLSLNASTGAVTGTATAAGSFSIKVVDSKGASATGTCLITIIAGPSLSCSSVTSGEVGVAFNSGAMTVTGGTSPYTFSVVGTLPAGLSLNASTGAVTGTATAAGSFSIKVVDSNGVAATGTCLITIIAGPSLSCSSVTSGEVGVAFNSGAMTVTGGTAPYTFSVVGTLPAGLSLNASNGAVTGTATAAGSFTIKVVDSNGVAATGTCLITIIAGPSLSCSSVTSGEVGVAFNSGAMTVTGGTSPYTFSVVGTLPAGLSLNASTGAVTGTATAAGSFSIKVVDSKGASATGTCLITIIAGPSPSCSSVTSGEVGVAFNSGAMTVTGGTAPYTFSVVGTLPAGLTLNASTGAVTGTATAAGSFTIKVVDSKGVSATGTCLITIIVGPTLSCSSVTSGEVGVAFNSGAMTVTGGTAPYTFSVVGTLPAGLTLNASTGAVTGTATAAGSFTIKVVDSKGVAATGTCLITIIAGPSLSCSSVTSGQVGVAFNSGVMTVTGGTSPYIFSVVGTLPAGLTLNTATGAVTGTATAAGSFSIKVTDAKGAISASTCTIAIAGTTGPSCVFGVASAYNLIALTGNISDSADITGRIAANGQVTQATTIGSGLKTGDTYLSLAKANGGPWAIVAAGGISTGGSFNINGGGNVYSSTATSANFNLANENYSGSAYAGSKLVIGGSSPINFTTLQTEMYALTKQLAGLTANGVVCSVNNSGLIIAGGGCPSSSKTYNPSWLVLYGTSTTTNIFNLTQAQFQGNNNLDIVVPTGSTVIVNVAGTSDTLNTSIYYNGATVADANASSILFNFASATTVTINAQFDAALLAPYAKLSGGSQMGGMFIAASIGSTGEVHYDAFMSSIPYSGTCSQ